MKQCQKCGLWLEDSMNFCPQCHARYLAPGMQQGQPATMQSPVSHQANAGQGESCCPAVSGTTNNSQVVLLNQKKRMVYVILGAILGELGIHNFYAGRWGQGLAQLLVCLFLVVPLSIASVMLGDTVNYVQVPLNLVTGLWVGINLLTITTDGHDNPMKSSKNADITAIVLAILTFALMFKTFVLPSNMNPFAGSRNSSYEEYDEGESDEDFWND